jgi:hypothetical protein
MSFTREQQDMLEAYGFDLMAQTEAILRHVREYQRGLQRLRGTLPKRRSADATQSPLAVMTAHIQSLRETLAQFDTCLAEVEAVTRNAPGDREPAPVVKGRFTRRSRTDNRDR